MTSGCPHPARALTLRSCQSSPPAALPGRCQLLETGRTLCAPPWRLRSARGGHRRRAVVRARARGCATVARCAVLPARPPRCLISTRTLEAQWAQQRKLLGACQPARPTKLQIQNLQHIVSQDALILGAGVLSDADFTAACAVSQCTNARRLSATVPRRRHGAHLSGPPGARLYGARP